MVHVEVKVGWPKCARMGGLVAEKSSSSGMNRAYAGWPDKLVLMVGAKERRRVGQPHGSSASALRADASPTAAAVGVAAPCGERRGRTTSRAPMQRRPLGWPRRPAATPSAILGEAARPVGWPVRSVVPLLVAISTAGSWARLVGMVAALPRARQQIKQVAQRRGRHEEDDAEQQQPGATRVPALFLGLPRGQGW